jgi:hypothetical protein
LKKFRTFSNQSLVDGSCCFCCNDEELQEELETTVSGGGFAILDMLAHWLIIFEKYPSRMECEQALCNWNYGACITSACNICKGMDLDMDFCESWLVTDDEGNI